MKFLVPAYSGLLIIDVKLKSKWKFSTVTVLFYNV